MAEGAGPRLAAARAVARVLGQGQSLAGALPLLLEPLSDPRDRALAQELAYGTLRWWPRLDALLAALLSKPLKSKEHEVNALLLVGLYQLAYLDTPPHAAVSATVAASGALKRPWARGLINGVLRNYQRRGAELSASVDGKPEHALAHPAWLLAAIREAWPDDWQTVADANNARPPFTLRVNARHQDRDAYFQQLQDAGLGPRLAPHTDAGLTLERAVAVESLPGFAEGRVSVQDGAAQLAAGLLELAPGQRVLDACAAPGGKTGHILELVPELSVLALDQDPLRLQRVDENLQRLGVAARLQAGDAAQPQQWWDGMPFDRILLDAPCSATGVIRRHPDIKALRRASDIPALADLQGKILRALWPLLKPGGILVYATCSILPAENAQQVARFLEQQGEARPLPISASWGRESGVGRQILPGQDGMDGFFYARLQKH